nr:lamin tail domain-containing protein [Candidatus Levybacteria bacterium]
MKAKSALVAFLLFLFCFSFSKPSFAAGIVINEFSSATSDDDWVELYNASTSQSEDLSNYTIIDGSTSGNPVSFNCILAPQGFVIAFWSNRLNNGGDIIRLKNVDTVVDCVAYGDGAGQKCDGKSAVDIGSIGSGEYGARSIDGTDSWIKTTIVTKDGPNNGSSKNAGAVCSMLTSTPTPSSTPTISLTSKSTPTPKPTNSPTPSVTNTPTVTKAISKTPASNAANATPTIISSEIKDVLGNSTKSGVNNLEQSKKENKKDNIQENNNFLPIIFISIGVVFL